MKKVTNVSEICVLIRNKLIEYGVQEHTAWYEYSQNYRPVIYFFLDKNQAEYGKYHNVFLSETEYGELKQEIRELDRLIEELSSYMRSSGKQYADHAVTLRRWAERSAPVKNILDYTCSEEDSL